MGKLSPFTKKSVGDGDRANEHNTSFLSSDTVERSSRARSHAYDTISPGVDESRPLAMNEESPMNAPSVDQRNDQTDGRIVYRSYSEDDAHHRSVSVEADVTAETKDYLKSYIAENLRNDGHAPPEFLRRQTSKVDSGILRCLMDMWDDLRANDHLNSLINSFDIGTENVGMVIFKICTIVFSDGKINWGRIAVLFYFAYRMSLKCVSDSILIQKIIDTICHFMAKAIMQWISRQGGWCSIKGATVLQVMGVFFAGCAVSAIIMSIIHKK